MRVHVVLAGLGFGGAERLALAIRDLAEGAGWTTPLEAAPAVRATLASQGTHCPGQELSLRRWVLAARGRVQAGAADLVHVHLSSPSLFGSGALIAHSLPTLFTFHLLPEGRWPADRILRVPSRWTLATYGRCARRARFNAVSRADARRLAACLPSARVRTVLNAPPEPQVDDAPLRWPWQDGVVRIVAVGRLDPQKGFADLVTAFADNALRALPVQLAIVGDGPEHTRLSALIRRHSLQERVLLTGAGPGSRLMQAADLVVSASRYEGMPLVPMEAVVVGTPVLVSDIPPHRELFGSTEDSLLPPERARWGATLASIIADPERRKRLGTAQAQLRPQLALPRLWGDYETLYHELLQEV